MGSYRADRTTEDVKRELTAIMGTLKDPRITGMLSIVKIDLARDLSLCKAYVSSLDGMDAAVEAVKGLNNAAGFVRRELGLRLSLRHTPAVKFIANNSIEQSAEILRILDKIDKPAEKPEE